MKKRKLKKLLSSLPVGQIEPFFGENIPKGWEFADGKDDKPDLRGESFLYFGEKIKAKWIIKTKKC